MPIIFTENSISQANQYIFRERRPIRISGFSGKANAGISLNGIIGELKNKLLHYSVNDYESYRKKMVHYGVLKGKELFAKGKKFNVITQYSKTTFKFLKTYILRLGFLDGKEGFQLSVLQTLSVFETYESLKKEEKKK
ncbi:hypothetical protein [Kaistella sp.]|uniref:hypothetical protein n=1 Tax=Kaistella sp. TaxID=2782235 RepID=UPI003FA57277